MKIYKRPGLLLLVFYLTISAVWGQKNVLFFMPKLRWFTWFS